MSKNRLTSLGINFAGAAICTKQSGVQIVAGYAQWRSIVQVKIDCLASNLSGVLDKQKRKVAFVFAFLAMGVALSGSVSSQPPILPGHQNRAMSTCLDSRGNGKAEIMSIGKYGYSVYECHYFKERKIVRVVKYYKKDDFELRLSFYANGERKEVMLLDKGKQIGPTEKYLENGKAKSVYQKDDRGNLLYVEYDDVGRIFRKTPIYNYKKDKIVYQEEYYPNGQVRMKVSLNSSGREEGVRESYYPNGKPASETTFKNGIPNGLHVEYDEDGVVTKRGTHKNGVLDCFPVQQDGIKTDDKGNSVYEEFHADGSLSLRVPLNETKKKDGIAEAFFESGKPVIRTAYKNGNTVGLHEEFFPNGQIKIRANFNGNNKPDGLYEEFDREGKPVKKGAYRNGKFREEE